MQVLTASLFLSIPFAVPFHSVPAVITALVAFVDPINFQIILHYEPIYSGVVLSRILASQFFVQSAAETHTHTQREDCDSTAALYFRVSNGN